MNKINKFIMLTCGSLIIANVFIGLIFDFKWSDIKLRRPSWGNYFIAHVVEDRIHIINTTIIPLYTSSKYCCKRPNYIPYPYIKKTYTKNEDKGHIVSLDLGLSNQEFNIIMQPKLWQRYYGQRQMEKWLKLRALQLYGWKKQVCANQAYFTKSNDFPLKIQMQLHYMKMNVITLICGTLNYNVEILKFCVKPFENMKIVNYTFF